MPAPPRLLIFDLDGTLIDSSLDLCNAVNAALAHVERPQLPNECIASFIGDGAATLISRALGDLHAEPLFAATYDYFLTWYRAHNLDNTRCYDGVLEALTAMRSRHQHLPMAILTNKPVNPSREICTALSLAPFFFQNYGGNSFPTKKPDPTGLLKLIAEAERLIGARIQPHEVTMIGDSDVDILTARNAGTRSLGCTFGLAPQALAAANPDTTVDHPREWPAALGL